MWPAVVLLAIMLAAAVRAWWPRRPTPPFPPVTDTVEGLARRTRGDRLSEPYDWDNDPKDAA